MIDILGEQRGTVMLPPDFTSYFGIGYSYFLIPLHRFNNNNLDGPRLLIHCKYFEKHNAFGPGAIGFVGIKLF